MSEAQAQTITPERQIAASQVGAVFNSLHEYLRTLEPKDAEGRSTLTQQLIFAHCRVDEAAMWAIKSVLTYGIPPRPAQPAAPAANDAPTADAAAPASETPAPIGVVDPPQALPDNAPTGADALPPTTPAESV
jgi:hypothetical protein